MPSGALASASPRSSEGVDLVGSICRVTRRRRWRSAERRSCRSAAPGWRTRGCRRVDARRARSPAASSSRSASAAMASTCDRVNPAGMANASMAVARGTSGRRRRRSREAPARVRCDSGERVTAAIRKPAVAGTLVSGIERRPGDGGRRLCRRGGRSARRTGGARRARSRRMPA